MLLFSGHWIKALILLVWGLTVVHPVDNLLRPHLIGSRTKLSTLFVFFALLGGLNAFGGLGVFIGPIVLAITLALLKFLREEKRTGNWSFDRESSQSPPTCRQSGFSKAAPQKDRSLKVVLGNDPMHKSSAHRCLPHRIDKADMQ